MFRVAVLFCAVLALVKGWTTDISRCSLHSGPLPINAHISGCTTQPCQLPQGQDAIINIIFRPPYFIHQMTTAATAIMLFVPLPYDLGANAATCNFLVNSNCPVVRDEVLMTSLRMRIEEFIPVGTQLPIEFRILDDSSTAIVCLRVQVRITPPLGKLGARNATVTAVNDDENMEDIYPI